MSTLHSHADREVTAATPPSANQLRDLQELIKQIGLARFIGRINSGIIPAEHGYAAVERYVSESEDRPLLSRVAHSLLGRRDSFLYRP